MSLATLNYSQSGEGFPLVIIHGLFGSSRNWQSLGKKFAEHFHVITIDLRNHGDSFRDEEMNYRVMAEDVIDLIDQLQIDQFSIIGHSMGGKVAMKLCHLKSDSVKDLVVADIAPVSYRHDYDEIISAILQLDLKDIVSRKQADTILSNSISDPAIRLFLMQNLVKGEKGFYWKLNWPVLKHSMPEITGFEDITDWDIHNRNLFIYGALSDYVNTQNIPLIEKHFRNAKFDAVDNAGHWLHAEQPQIFYQKVSHFLLNPH